MRTARLVSTGAYLPPIEVTNDDLRARFAAAAPDFVDKMEAGSGILSRWYARDDQRTSDLAVEAARVALDRADLRPTDVDLILLGTDSPDFITPATSTVVQHKLGASCAGTFDVGCACASFPTAFASAAGLIATNPGIRRVLVIGAYLMHRLADPGDPMTFFYGDGAGAAVLAAGDRPGFVGSAFQADGAFANHWGIFSGGTAEPASEISVREGRTRVRMLERYPPEVNHEGWPRLVRRLASGCGFAVSDIDFIVFTQVRKPSIELVMDDLGLPRDRTHTIMERWGYTGSACIPMALDDACRAGRIAPGDLVVLVGSGVGYNQAAIAYRA
jgi:3-oxoacyl-[acyl-carrier-protein] synthase III